jgi:hypothetical protein
MAKFIWFFRKECPICNGIIGELVKELLVHKIPIIKLPINDQIYFRIYNKYLTLTIFLKQNLMI